MATPTDGVPDPRLKPLYDKITWRLLPFLLLCYVFAYLDRVNIGFAKLQMQADIFNKEIAVAGVSEAAAFGAAYVAMAAVGAVNSLKQPLKCMNPQKIIRPITENNRVYMDAYGNFKNLYAKIYGSC